ncbi:MAG: histidine phosphatase family protein [Actinomycetota bacterium]|nr:histidine phosphatase family protein [Actinomycetota bacterium]
MILVRHGQSEGNAAGLLLGRADSSMTPLGRAQAARLGEALAERAGGSRGPGGRPLGVGGASLPMRLLTSPLTRARLTAETIAEALGPNAPAPEDEERLVELDYGELEGRRPAELSRDLWAQWRADASWRPPGGESFLDLHRRLDPLWESLREEATEGDVIVVSHVSPIKAAVAWVLGASPDLAWKLSLGVASITTISFAGPAPVLVSFGETGHLLGL